MILQDKDTGVLYRHWQAGIPKAMAVLVHGLGGHSARWEFLAQYLLKEGIASYAIELKGFGESPDTKGHIDSFGIYYRDIQALADIACRQNSGVRVFLAGESLGGLLSFVMAARMPVLFSGLICIAPAFETRMTFGFIKRVQIFAALICCPKKQFKMPLESAMCTRDESFLAGMRDDPREHRLASAQLLYNTVRAQAYARHAQVRIPAVFLLPGADTVVDSSISRKVFSRLKTGDKTLLEYPGMLHSIPIDTGRQKAFEDIAGWILARASATR